MVQLVLQRRDYLKASTALGGVPELLAKIREVLLHRSCCHFVIHLYQSFKIYIHLIFNSYLFCFVLFTLSSTVSRLLHGNEVGVYKLE